MLCPFAEDRATRNWGRDSCMKSSFRLFFLRSAILMLLPLLLNGCGSSYTVTTPPTTFTIGGMVTNLAGTGLVLQDNGGNNFPVAANGSFTFTTAVANGGAYSVTVSTQPSSPAQFCGVVNGSGAASANVTSVIVNCDLGEWGWMSGSNATNQNANGIYGTLNVPAPGNVPGVRNFGSSSWTDSSGNLWLFGGSGLDSASAIVGDLNDLWKYNIASGEWTWVSGSNAAGQAGTYGTLQMPASGNVPGARDTAVSWIDSSGNLWLFGGEFTNSVGTTVYFNDLWEYSVTNNNWTWMGGSNATNMKGTYGALNVTAPGNIPGARDFSTAQVSSGNVFLFGGFGYDSAGATGDLNDLWKYNLASGQWTWLGGSNVVPVTGGTYGTQNVPAAGNLPGARFGAASWTDASGNFWLFGGSGLDSVATNGFLNDLWEYSVSSDEWTWTSGSNLANKLGIYGTEGMGAASNVPGARSDSSAWTDKSGNFWLFGGFGSDSAGTQSDLNDLWEYSVTNKDWTWMSGSNLGDQNGVYGTLGMLAPANVPGNREGGASWTDASGNLWLFGGSGILSVNDLWMYLP
jgi:N-acetylneuraminic acid mutarotase